MDLHDTTDTIIVLTISDNQSPTIMMNGMMFLLQLLLFSLLTSPCGLLFSLLTISIQLLTGTAAAFLTVYVFLKGTPIISEFQQ